MAASMPPSSQPPTCHIQVISTEKTFHNSKVCCLLIYSVASLPSLTRLHLAVKVVDHQPQAQLHQEQRAQGPGVARGEAVMLVDGAAASAERDDGDQETEEDQEHGD